MNPNPFAGRYNQYSNAELLNIIDHPTDFQPLEIEAAREEIARRNLTKKHIASMSSKHAKATETPFIRGAITTQIVLLGIIFLYKVYENISLYKYLLLDPSSFGSTVAFDSVMLLVLVCGIVCYWLRKRIGWTLLATYAIISVVIDTYTLFTINYNLEATELLFSVNLFTRNIASVLWFGALFGFLCTEKLRAVYTIDKRTMHTTISVAISIAILVCFYLYSLRM